MCDIIWPPAPFKICYLARILKELHEPGIVYREFPQCVERGSSVGRMPDSQSREPGFESPFATGSKLGHFRSLHDASVDSAV